MKSRTDMRSEIRQEGRTRARAYKFGDPITNVCAGHPSRRHSYFVEAKSRGDEVRSTDKAGEFWTTDSKVIFAGHLSDDECKVLFDPIWKAEFGDRQG